MTPDDRHPSADYLEALYELEEEGFARVQAELGRWMGVSRPSVSEHVKRLVADGLLVQDGRDLRFTDAGRTKAHDDTTLFFGCPDVDGAFTFLREKGIDATDPKTTYYGIRQVWFHDPDGYGLCLQWRAGEEGGAS